MKACSTSTWNTYWENKFVQWSKVERLESKQLFLVKTEGGSVYAGTLSTAESSSARPVKIQVVEASGTEFVIDREHIVQMDTTSESTQYNLGSEVTYPRERLGGDSQLCVHVILQYRR